FAIGERVAPNSMLNNLTGKEDIVKIGSRTLGSYERGVFCEYAVFQRKHLVRLPKHLSWEEVTSMISCGGVTAWSALKMFATVLAGNKSALLQGTGGVALIALLVCLAAGIHPIV
ncbi:hypothetical protein C8R43DRAFT_859258, partial [Mycena crocata]